MNYQSLESEPVQLARTESGGYYPRRFQLEHAAVFRDNQKDAQYGLKYSF